MNIQMRRRQRPILQIRIPCHQNRKVRILCRRLRQPRQTLHAGDIQILFDGEIRTTAELDLRHWEHRQRCIITGGFDRGIKGRQMSAAAECATDIKVLRLPDVEG